MIKRLILVILLAITFLASGPMAHALALPVNVYVDFAWTGGEDGTQSKPYNTIQEATAFAQSKPGGGNIYIKQGNDWVFSGFVASVNPGAGGVPLTDALIYSLLAFLALVLILVGWQFQRRSRQFKAL